jgi:hypothetical protein
MNITLNFLKSLKPELVNKDFKSTNMTEHNL